MTERCLLQWPYHRDSMHSWHKDTDMQPLHTLTTPDVLHSGSCCSKRNFLIVTRTPSTNFCLNQLKCSSKTIHMSLMFSQPASTQVTMAVPSTTTPKKCKSMKADPKAELTVWAQISGSLAAAILANTSLTICEMITNWWYQNRSK